MNNKHPNSEIKSVVNQKSSEHPTMVSADAESGVIRRDSSFISHEHLVRCTGLSSTNLEKMAQDEKEPADFETAVAATGYGRFNIFLLLCTLPAFWCAVSVPSSVSYIFSRAKCDLNLSLIDMGTVTSITYGGMISSAMLWGFLSDTLGRKRIMVAGFLATGVVDIMAAMSQSFGMMLVSRFMCGFLFNGPFAILLSYIAELHRTEWRAKIIVFTSMFYTLANTTLPLVAWGILTKDIHVPLFGGSFVIHAWNVFLFATALMPVVTGLACTCLPESPKFLMSRGRNDEAMEIFKKIYAMNSGKSGDDFPIRVLAEEKQEAMAKGFAALRGGFQQMAPLFGRQHGPWLSLLCTLHIGCMFGANSLRLWFPQMAAMISSSTQQDMCSALAPQSTQSIQPSFPEELEVCVPLETNMMTYLQSALVGAGSVITYAIGGAIVNKCGKKLVAATCLVISGITALFLPFFGEGPFMVVGLISGSLAFSSLCMAALNSIMVDLFPTSLRVMALAIFLMSGRLGTIAGTVAFPALMELGCSPPFVAIAVVLMVCGLACFCIPNTTLKKLE